MFSCCVCQNTSLPRPRSYKCRCTKLICNIMIWDSLLYNFDAACKTTAFPSNSTRVSKLICVQFPQFSPDGLGDFRPLKWVLEKNQIWDQWKLHRKFGSQMRTRCVATVFHGKHDQLLFCKVQSKNSFCDVQVVVSHERVAFLYRLYLDWEENLSWGTMS